MSKPIMLLIAQESERVSFRLMCDACDAYEDGTGTQAHMLEMLKQYDTSAAMCEMERRFSYLNDITMLFAKGEASNDERAEAMADYVEARNAYFKLISLSGLKITKEIVSGYLPA